MVSFFLEGKRVVHAVRERRTQIDLQAVVGQTHGLGIVLPKIANRDRPAVGSVFEQTSHDAPGPRFTARPIRGDGVVEQLVDGRVRRAQSSGCSVHQARRPRAAGNRQSPSKALPCGEPLGTIRDQRVAHADPRQTAIGLDALFDLRQMLSVRRDQRGGRFDHGANRARFLDLQLAIARRVRDARRVFGLRAGRAGHVGRGLRRRSAGIAGDDV